MIDVIIPCYNSHKTLPKTLGSILGQDDYSVTLVNDGGNPYTDIVKDFSKYMPIREIGYESNKGPGYARTYGLQHTDNELITFIDSDDLISPFALYLLKKEIRDKQISCGVSVEVTQPFAYVRHRDMIWIHGKMYRREFLNKYNILFNDTRANEDLGFNLLCELCSDSIGYINEEIYYWCYNPNSMVRENAENYSNNLSVTGFTENTIWAFNEAAKRGISEDKMIPHKVEILIKMCILYYQTRKTEFNGQNYNNAKRYYYSIIKPIESRITEDIFRTEWKKIPGIITIQHFYKFLEDIK